VSDVSDYFVEGSQFNSTIFNNVTWALDDSTILGERGAHEKFSGLVKKVVANPSFPYDAKWGYKGSVPFNGRFICTMNDGPASIRILPDTDQDLLDKVIFLRTGRVPAKMCGSEEANLERVTAELPAFLRWLTNTDHADWVSCKDERCGIDSWHEPSILSEAKSESRSGSLGEILDMWRESCAASGKDKGHWEGTSAQLLQTLGESACINRLIQGIKTPNYLSGLLNALIDGGYKYATRPARKRIRIDF
jgi:hypothetical protein